MADGHTLVIEGLSEGALRALEAKARAHGRQIEAEARDVLERTITPAFGDGAEGEAARRAWFLAESDRIRAMTPKGVDQPDSTLMIREARDAGYWRG